METPLLPFGSSKLPKKGVLEHFYRRRDQFLDPKLIDPNDYQPFYILGFFGVSMTLI